jgi:hypothetical protein
MTLPFLHLDPGDGCSLPASSGKNLIEQNQGPQKVEAPLSALLRRDNFLSVSCIFFLWFYVP